MIGTEKTRLRAIKGTPPDLVALSEGCPFAPRCDRVVRRCLEEMPPLDAVSENHFAACWNMNGRGTQ
jgi:oligopeptide transport system ATP-binding protein